MIKYYLGFGQNHHRDWIFFATPCLKNQYRRCFYIPILIPAFLFKKGQKVFFEQLALLQEMGVSIPKSLEILCLSPKPCLPMEILKNMQHQLESGFSFQQCFENHAEYFSPLIRSFLCISHHNGQLIKLIDIYLQEEQKIQIFINKMKQQLAYPGFLILMLGFFLFFFTEQTLPQYQNLSIQLQNHPLPSIDWILKIQSNLWYLPIVMLILGVYRKKIFNQLAIKKNMDWWLWTVLMQTGIENGLSWLACFEMIEKNFKNLHFQSWLHQTQAQFRAGISFEQCFKNTPGIIMHYLPLLKTSPHPDQILKKLNRYFIKEIEKKLSQIERYTQPVLMFIIAGLMGSTLWMLYQPLFEMGYHF